MKIENNILSDTEIKKYLLPKYKNFSINIFEVIDSTNIQAKRLIAEKTFDFL